jgi:glycosyltransferase involved in cell wall biosynthesis
MRVALLTNFIPPYRVPLYEALAREVGELRVFISTSMEGNRDWQPEWGALDVTQQRTFTVQRTWQTEAFSEQHEVHVPYDTIAQLLRWRPHVILTMEMGARSLQAVTFARITRTPAVLWALLSDRLENGRGRLRQKARSWLVNQVDSIIVNGESGARYFRRFGVADERVLRIHQSVDMRELLSLPLQRPERSTLQLLHVGSLSERKGVSPLLAAVDLWAAANPTRNLALTFVGNGPLRDRLQQRSTQPNVEIRWVGSVPYHELPVRYGAADVLLFPSLGDEWGLVVNEALAAGVPVMGSVYSQAVEELIRDGVNGWLFQPDDPSAISAALKRVLDTEPDQLWQMRHQARESVRAWTPEANAAHIANRLREAAAK